MEDARRFGAVLSGAGARAFCSGLFFTFPGKQTLRAPCPSRKSCRNNGPAQKGRTAALGGDSGEGKPICRQDEKSPLTNPMGKRILTVYYKVKCADKGGAPPTSLSESRRLLRGGRECGANHLGADRPNQTVSRYGTSRYRSGHCWMPDKGVGDCFPAIGVVPRKKQRFRL